MDQSSEGHGPFSLEVWAHHVLGRQHMHQEVSNFNCAKRLAMAHRDLSNLCRSTQKKLRLFAGKLRRFAGKLRRFKKCIFAKKHIVLQKLWLCVVWGKWRIETSCWPTVLQASPLFASLLQIMLLQEFGCITWAQTSPKPSKTSSSKLITVIPVLHRQIPKAGMDLVKQVQFGTLVKEEGTIPPGFAPIEISWHIELHHSVSLLHIRSKASMQRARAMGSSHPPRWATSEEL